MTDRFIEVWIWQQRVGAVAFDPGSDALVFEYDQKWIRSGVDLAPITMPIAAARRLPLFQFPELPEKTYRGLPGMLADALPDAFGNALINAWMASRGVKSADVSVLDRLAYMGSRGMGALEFRPTRGSVNDQSTPIAMQSLVEAARSAVRGDLGDQSASKQAIQSMIDVGTSAGGARAKAVIAWNPETNEVRSGQFDAPEGFEHWLLKLDIGEDMVLGDSHDFGRVEYAYSRMAVEAGVDMMPCRILNENGRSHFMTQRFDRDHGEKHHIQTLCAMSHLDFNQHSTHSYEQFFMAANDLVGQAAVQQIFARMCLNIASRNCDDHTKNMAFRLRRGGAWELTPAYDVTHSYRAESVFVCKHQMSVNGAFDDITTDDIMAIADRFGVERPTEIIARVNAAVEQWPVFAQAAGVSPARIDAIAADHRVIDAAPAGGLSRRRTHGPR